MRVSVKTQYLHKHGNAPDEYEDAFHPRSWIHTDAWYFRAAVSDGATETSFAAAWANELAEGYCKRRISETQLAATIPRVQRRWKAGLSYVELPWYAEEKLRQGAFSSLLGMTIFDRNGARGNGARGNGANAEVKAAVGRSWSAIAAGDTCLFQIRDDNLLAAFPVAEPEQFNNRPRLLSSLPAYNNEIEASLFRLTGDWRAGDRFLLMTDALALWFLTSALAGEEPWGCLSDSLRSPVFFERLISCLREHGTLRNDDVTAMSIVVA